MVCDLCKKEIAGKPVMKYYSEHDSRPYCQACAKMIAEEWAAPRTRVTVNYAPGSRKATIRRRTGKHVQMGAAALARMRVCKSQGIRFDRRAF
jgi:hypothetical protein